MTDIQKLKLIASAVSSKDEWYTTKTIGAFPEYENDKDFVIAANPAAVLELIADLESYQVGAKVEADAGDEARSEVRKLKAENEALRKIISDSATSCGAAVSVECSLDFMAHLPVEIFSVISKLRNALAECSGYLHAEMLQKFGGQLPGEMHPVTRREYDRDMAEVAGYRAAMSKGEQP